MKKISQRGYTLAELLITLGVLGLLALCGTGLFLVFRILWRLGSSLGN